MSQEKEPLTERAAIEAALRELETGDEVTVEDSYGNKVNEAVTGVADGTIDIGEYGTVRHRVLDIDTVRMCEVTEDAMDPVTVGNDIETLWVWS